MSIALKGKRFQDAEDVKKNVMASGGLSQLFSKSF
jgi:hypothetical protein